MAEGLAMREAALMCRRNGLKSIRFESDSAALVKALNSGSSEAGLYGILSIAFEFDFVCFVWISRERNSVADSLAKAALNDSVSFVVVEGFNAPN